jgi:hypothetical protein
MKMQNNQITFVIGAGASKEVELPIGDELKGQIASALKFRVVHGSRIEGGNPTVVEAMYKLAQKHTEPGADINSYLQASRLISGAMPQAESIDNFIDSHRSDIYVNRCGKLAIAACILKAERGSRLWFNTSNNRNTIDFDGCAASWFSALFRVISQNSERSGLAAKLKRIRIITFNYDRCIEHYLHRSFQNYYSMSQQEATDMLGNLEIYHPYGKVGNLHWEVSGGGVEFGGEAHADDLAQIAGSLRTFTEGTDTTVSQIEAIRECVQSASNLIFLGFAFHELNLQILYGSGPNLGNQTQVYGSAYRISDSNLRIILDDLIRLGGHSSKNMRISNQLTAAGAMSEYSRSLRLQ